jgi:hypothetical protein
VGKIKIIYAYLWPGLNNATYSDEEFTLKQHGQFKLFIDLHNSRLPYYYYYYLYRCVNCGKGKKKLVSFDWVEPGFRICCVPAGPSISGW